MLLFFSSIVILRGQEIKELNGSYKDQTALEILESIQTKLKINIYFVPDWFDSKKLNLDLDGIPPEEAIQIIVGDQYTIVNVLEDFVISKDPYYPVSSDFVKETIDEIDDGETKMLGFLFKEEVDKLKESKTMVVGDQSLFDPSKKINLSGKVLEINNSEPLAGVLIYTSNNSTTTDENGEFSIQVPFGKSTMSVQYLGMKSRVLNLLSFSSDKISVYLEEDLTTLQEVVVTSNQSRKIETSTMGVELVSIKEIKTTPMVLGENDIIREMLSLPGVTSIGEGAIGFNVRGGGADQNLVLLDNQPVYNPSHFFGFFSAFNDQYIGSSQLYKSSIPVKYGGRLSSVLTVSSESDFDKEFSGSGSITPVTLKGYVHLPIIDSLLFIDLGFRGTYSDWVLNSVKNQQIKDTDVSFYDVNAKINYKISDTNIVGFDFYRSGDSFNLLNDSLFTYSNTAFVFADKIGIKDNLDGEFSFGVSNYNFEILHDENPSEAFKYRFMLNEIFLKTDFNLFIRDYAINFGSEFKRYDVKPRRIFPVGDASLIRPERSETESGLESAIYLSNSFDLNRLSFEAGLRLSFFGVSDSDSYIYDSEVPRSTSSIIDTVRVENNSFMTYWGPEFRVSAKYQLFDRSVFKLSYNQSRQYIHLLSNTTSVAPTDIWKLSDEYIKPLYGKQISAGYYRETLNGYFEFSTEVFYKKSSNNLEVKLGEEILNNELVEASTIQGEGKSYGIELMLSKKYGDLTGRINYTFSRSFLKMDSEFRSEQINRGGFYPSNQDRPHVVSLDAKFAFTKRFSTSMKLSYQTGRPVTFPIGQYKLGGENLIYYSDRNEFRIPDYFRIDLGFSLDGNYKRNKPFHGFWSFSVYNLLGRDNPYSIYFEEVNGRIKGYQLSIFANPVPTLAYNFRF